MMNVGELDLVRTSLREVLRGTDAAALPRALLESGWSELVDAPGDQTSPPDADASSGSDAAAVLALLAQESGRVLANGPVLDLAVVHAVGLPADDVTAVVLPPVPARGAVAACRSGPELEIDGLAFAGVGRAKRLLLVTADDAVAVDPAAVTVSPVGGLDPDLGLLSVRGTVAASESTPLADRAGAIAATASARRFLAGQLAAIAAVMLDKTVTYVGQRHQYGRAIGSFQAVKHRLADVQVACSAADDAVAIAWEDGGYFTALAAKALAGRAFLTAATHCQQVHGAIAFTAEHDLHRYVRRGYVLDALLGSADDLAWELGERLYASRSVPRLPRL